MAHGTLSRDQDQRVICALPAKVRREARLIACRFPNAPWRLAVLGGRLPRRLTIDENGDLIVHIAVTGFVRPTQDQLPGQDFLPSYVAEHIVMPLDHPARPGDRINAWRIDEAVGWQETETIIGNLVATPDDAPYRVHQAGMPTEPAPAPEQPAPRTNASEPRRNQPPVQQTLLPA